MKQNYFSPSSLCSLLAISSMLLFSCNNSSQSEVVTDTTKVTTVDTTIPSTPIQVDTMPAAMVNHAEATLAASYPDTSVEGTIKFDTVSGGKVKMMLEIKIPAKAGKTVGVHIHEHGDCGDAGNLAHGHWNPTNKEHGKWGTGNFHAGDIGNVKLNAQGRGTLSLTTNLWSLGGSSDKNVLGKSIIVHGGTDDFKTQPAGNTGTRIGCGVIK